MAFLIDQNGIANVKQINFKVKGYRSVDTFVSYGFDSNREKVVL